MQSFQFIVPAADFSAENGYCYLVWFAPFGRDLVSRAAESLGPFPRIRDVLLNLVRLSKTDLYLQDVVFRGGTNILHVGAENFTPLSELVREYVFTEYRVGGLTDFFTSSSFPTPLLPRPSFSGITFPPVGFPKLDLTDFTIINLYTHVPANRLTELLPLAQALGSDLSRLLSDIPFADYNPPVPEETPIVKEVLKESWTVCSFFVRSTRTIFRILCEILPGMSGIIWRNLLWVGDHCHSPAYTLCRLTFMPLRAYLMLTYNYPVTTGLIMLVFIWPQLNRIYGVRRGTKSICVLLIPNAIGAIASILTLSADAFCSIIDLVDELFPRRLPPPPPPRYVPGILGTRLRIGGPVDTDLLIKTAGINVEEVRQQVAKEVLDSRLMTDGPGTLQGTQLDMLSNRTYTVYYFGLESLDVTELRACYPRLTFEERGDFAANSHEFAAVARRAEKKRLAAMYHACGDQPPPHSICDVGGDVRFAAANKMRHIHICGKICGVKDGARKTDEQLGLQTMLWTGQLAPNSLNAYDINSVQSIRCLDGVENCKVKAAVAWEIHVYDISMEMRMKYFDTKEIMKCHTIMLFSPIILLEKNVILRPTNVAVARTTDDDGIEWITFTFLNDASACYRHKYLDYIAPFTTNYCVTPQGHVYHLERFGPRINQYEIVWTRVSGSGPLDINDVLVSKYSGTEGYYTALPVVEYFGEYYAENPNERQLRRRVVMVPTEMWETALRIASSHSTSEGRYKRCVDSLSAFNSKKTIEGMSFTVKRRLPHNELRLIAQTAEIYTYRAIEESLKAITIQKKAADEMRNGHNFGLLDFLRLNDTLRTALDKMDDHLDSYLTSLDKAVPREFTNYGEITAIIEVEIQTLISASINATVAQIKNTPAVTFFEHFDRLERAAKQICPAVPALPRASNRLSQRITRDLIASTCPPELSVHLSRSVRGLSKTDSEPALTLVNVAADGKCLFNSLYIASNFEFDSGVPFLSIDLIRSLIYRFLVDRKSFRDRITPEYADTLYTSLLEEKANLLLEISVGDPKTWANLAMLAWFAALTHVNVVRKGVHKKKGVESETRSYLYKQIDSDVDIYIALGNTDTLLTHATPYTYDLSINLQARFAEQVTSALRAMPRVGTPYDLIMGNRTIFGHEVSLTRLMVKYLECAQALDRQRGEPLKREKVLEVGGAPGSWSTLLHYQYPESHITTISPYDGSSDLCYAPEVFDLYSAPNRELISTSLEEFEEIEEYDLIVVDAATRDSWRTNLPMTDHITILMKHLRDTGDLIIKIPNFLLPLRATVSTLHKNFKRVTIFKPTASRPASTEAFFICTGFGQGSSFSVVDTMRTIENLCRPLCLILTQRYVIPAQDLGAFSNFVAIRVGGPAYEVLYVFKPQYRHHFPNHVPCPAITMMQLFASLSYKDVSDPELKTHLRTLSCASAGRRELAVQRFLDNLALLPLFALTTSENSSIQQDRVTVFRKTSVVQTVVTEKVLSTAERTTCFVQADEPPTKVFHDKQFPPVPTHDSGVNSSTSSERDDAYEPKDLSEMERHYHQTRESRDRQASSSERTSAGLPDLQTDTNPDANSTKAEEPEPAIAPEPPIVSDQVVIEDLGPDLAEDSVVVAPVEVVVESTNLGPTSASAGDSGIGTKKPTEPVSGTSSNASTTSSDAETKPKLTWAEEVHQAGNGSLPPPSNRSWFRKMFHPKPKEGKKKTKASAQPVVAEPAGAESVPVATPAAPSGTPVVSDGKDAQKTGPQQKQTDPVLPAKSVTKPGGFLRNPFRRQPAGAPEPEPKPEFRIRRKINVDDYELVAGLKYFNPERTTPTAVTTSLLLEDTASLRAAPGGLFNYSMTVCIGKTGPIYHSLRKLLASTITEHEPRTNGGMIWTLTHPSNRKHIVLVFDASYDWRISLGLLMTAADGVSVSGRRIKVVFDEMRDAYYHSMPGVLQGCSGLVVAFASPIYVPAVVRDLLTTLKASIPASKDSSAYYVAFSQTQQARDNKSYLVDVPSTVTTAREKQLLAMAEYGVYNQRFRSRMAEICGPVYRDLLSCVNVLQHLGNQYNLWNTKTRSLIFPDQWNRKWTDVSCCYTDAGLVPWDSKEGNFQTTAERVLVAKDLNIVLDERFLQVARTVQASTQSLPALFWLNGPPGCGKSTMLLNSFELGKTMLIAITNSATEDLRRRLMEEDGLDEKDAVKYVRTAMSLLLMSEDRLSEYKGVENIYVDEATMLHPGAVLYAVTRLPSVRVVVMVGDRNQIPFVDRLHVGILQFSSPSTIAECLPELAATYRCPLDVVYALRELYNELYTTSEILRSVEVTRHQLPRTAGALYLTFTQAEKAEVGFKVKDVVGARVLTITEAQGLTYEHVVVVRLQVNDLAIYGDKAQAVTAFTRHRRSLTYFTVAPVSDALTLFIERAVLAKSTDIAQNNIDNKAKGVGKPSLRRILAGVGLRIGGDLQIPKLDDRFFAALAQAGKVPAFKNFRLLASLGTASLSLGTAYYYRGPLTQWRLGDTGSTAPYPPGQLLMMASSHLLTASRSLTSLISKPSLQTCCCLSLSTLGCVIAYLSYRRLRRRSVQPPAMRPAGLQYLCSLPENQLSAPPLPYLQQGHVDLGSIQVYGNLTMDNNGAHNLGTVPKSSPVQSKSSNTSTNVNRVSPPTFPIVSHSTEHSPITVSVPSAGQPKSTANQTASLPPNNQLRIGGPRQDLNVQHVKRLKSNDTRLGVLRYKVPTIISSFLASLVRKRVRFVSSEELLQSVDHVTSMFTPAIPEPLPLPKVIAPRSVHKRSGSIANLQHWYDMAFPAAIGIEYSEDPDIVQNSDIKIAIEGITLDCDRAGYLAPLFDSLRPTLRTMMSSRRPATQLETILGFAKRNGNVPKLAVGYPPQYIAELLLENYIESVIDNRDVFEDFVNHPIKPSVESLDNWIATQDNPEVLRYLSQSVEPVETRVYNVFSYMIKQAVKAPSSNADALKYQSVQTIAFQPKDVNIIFCPIFVELRNRLLSVMNPKFLFYTGMSPDEFETEINTRFDAETLFSCERVENDIGKYDKSMPAYYLIFEIALFMKLGLDPHLAEIWYNSHVRSLYTDKNTGFSAIVDFQRRSGDASTFLGNTIINQAACVAIYNPKDIVCGLYAGDDHLIFGHNISYDTAGIFADLFNFEAKTLATLKYPYFCGKFLLQSGPYIYVVPDPVRAVTKMGRRDLRNFDHVEEYRTSMQDVTAPLNNVFVEFTLNDAITERYKTEYIEHNILVDSILYLVNNPTEFHKLYNCEGHFVLNFDPSRHDLDI